jgi:transcriptional regulator with XRE-family HTH domain
MDISPIQLGAEFRRLRHQAGFTQRQVSERLGGGLKERDVQRIEAGLAGRLSPQQMQALLSVYGRDMTCFRTDRLGTAKSGDNQTTDAGIAIAPAAFDENSTLLDLAEFRSRLHLAIEASNGACRRSEQLLRASRRCVALRSSHRSPS